MVLLQGIYDASNIGIYHAVTTEIWKEKKNSLVQFYIFLLMMSKKFLCPPSPMKP